MSGPAPTPTEILKLRGSWRADTRPNEPQPKKGAPPCPRRLKGEARQIWKSVCRILAEMNVLTRADGAQLERYCTYLARWRECEDFIAKNGATYPMYTEEASTYIGRMPDGRFLVGWCRHPHVTESRALDSALKQMEANFGLTPAARTRIATVGAQRVTGLDEFREAMG